MSHLWYWKKDLRLRDEDESAWEPFDADQEKLIEVGYQKTPRADISLNKTYMIDYKNLVQYRKGVRSFFRQSKK